jgi:hypothetical protein
VGEVEREREDACINMFNIILRLMDANARVKPMKKTAD